MRHKKGPKVMISPTLSAVQVPSLQGFASLQAILQPAQFSLSEYGFTFWALQVIVAVDKSSMRLQTEFTHPNPALQTLPQLPQLAESLVESTTILLQIISPWPLIHLLFWQMRPSAQGSHESQCSAELSLTVLEPQ